MTEYEFINPSDPYTFLAENYIRRQREMNKIEMEVQI